MPGQSNEQQQRRRRIDRKQVQMCVVASKFLLLIIYTHPIRYGSEWLCYEQHIVHLIFRSFQFDPVPFNRSPIRSANWLAMGAVPFATPPSISSRVQLRSQTVSQSSVYWLCQHRINQETFPQMPIILDMGIKLICHREDLIHSLAHSIQAALTASWSGPG